MILALRSTHLLYNILSTQFTDHATATGVLVRQTFLTTFVSVGCKTLCNFRLISTKYSKVFWKISRRLISRSFPFSVNTVLFPALTQDTRDNLPMLESQSFQASTFSDSLHVLASPSKLEYTKKPDFGSRGTSMTKVIFRYENAQIPIKSRETESLEFELISCR